MLGAAFRAAANGIELSDIQHMLNNPSPANFVNCRPMQPNGLHLVDVNYDPEDLLGATDRVQDLPLSSPLSSGKILEPIDWDLVNLLPPEKQRAQNIVNSEILAKGRLKDELSGTASGQEIGLEPCQNQSENGEWNSLGGRVPISDREDLQQGG